MNLEITYISDIPPSQTSLYLKHPQYLKNPQYLERLSISSYFLSKISLISNIWNISNSEIPRLPFYLELQYISTILLSLPTYLKLPSISNISNSGHFTFPSSIMSIMLNRLSGSNFREVGKYLFWKSLNFKVWILPEKNLRKIFPILKILSLGKEKRHIENQMQLKNW